MGKKKNLVLIAELSVHKLIHQRGLANPAEKLSR
jgi:hypothetical protein